MSKIAKKERKKLCILPCRCINLVEFSVCVRVCTLCSSGVILKKQNWGSRDVRRSISRSSIEEILKNKKINERRNKQLMKHCANKQCSLHLSRITAKQNTFGMNLHSKAFSKLLAIEMQYLLANICRFEHRLYSVGEFYQVQKRRR